MKQRMILLTSVFLSLTSFAHAEPQQVPSTAVIDEAHAIKEATSLLGLADEFTVVGNTKLDSYFVGAKRIIFKSGARLIFSDKAINSRNNLIVAARTIVSEDQLNPGTITWDSEASADEVSPISGQSPGGAHGRGDGASGGPGSNGALGNPGSSGSNAPNLVLFVQQFENAPPKVILHGQNGGKGGIGQRGGDGGVGQRGSPASQSAFDCKSGPGHGGNGGPGGVGGKGGQGGQGGTGGTVTLVSLPSAFPALLQLVRVDVGPGDGGPGGDGGQGGDGGPAGEAGEKSLPYCQARPDRRGSPGANGGIGAIGDPGGQGIQGDILFTTLDSSGFDNIFSK